MGLTGFNPLQYDGPVFDVIKYAAFGKPFTDGVYGGIYNIRKSAHYTGPMANVHQDVIHKSLTDTYGSKLELVLYADKIKTIQNNYNLLANGPINLALELPSQQWINHVDNGIAGNGKPNLPASGSWLMGGEMTFEATDKDRSLKIDFAGNGYPNEMTWMAANTAEIATGGSSGNAITGLAQMVYDLAQYGQIGIIDCTIDGASVGVLDEGCKATIKFSAPNHVATRGWPIIAFAESDIELPILQVHPGLTWPTTIGWALTDHTVIITFGDGMQLHYVNSLIPTPNPEFTEEKMGVNKLSFKNRIPIDRPSWNGKNIYFNTTGSTQTVNGYSLPDNAIGIFMVGYAAV